MLHRRGLIGGTAALGGLGLLGGCATTAATPPVAGAAAPPGPQRLALAPIRASVDRIFDITVCTRPFRAAGPRLDTEEIGDAFVVHNYGHGGSGWSLSWGSSSIAVEKAMSKSPREVAVIGCGALGLTSAILAQQAGAKVTIYARDLLPDARSSRATGSWTPDSRIALASHVDPAFPALWEKMARTSFKTYRRFYGLPGTPVEWIDRYSVFDSAGGGGGAPAEALDFAYYSERIADLTPHSVSLPEGSTPFPGQVRRSETLIFNIADYGHTLISDFLLAGGTIRRAEFQSPSQIAALPQKVIINCPGYGARALWKDESLTPVRGQIAWLIPQADVHYGVFYRGVNVLPRRDGVVVQDVTGGDMRGYGDASEVPDRAEAETAVKKIADLYAHFGEA